MVTKAGDGTVRSTGRAKSVQSLQLDEMLDSRWRKEESGELTSRPSFVCMRLLSPTVSTTPMMSTISLANMSFRSLILRSCNNGEVVVSEWHVRSTCRLLPFE